MRYKFRTNNGLLKVLHLAFPLYNFAIVMFVGRLLISLLYTVGLDDIFTKEVADVYSKIFYFLGTIAAVSYIIGAKGVFVKHDHITIARYTTTLRNWLPIIKIPYYKMESVQDNFKDLRFTKYHGSLLTPLGDSCYNVQITMKNGRKYFVSIENQEEFCDVVNAKIEEYNKAQQNR